MSTFNFIEKYKIPKKICDDLITYYKKNIEYKNIGQIGLGINKKMKDSTDVSFYNNSLSKLQAAADTDQNLMPFIVNSVKTYATTGEISNTLREVFGEYRPKEVF